MLNFLLLRTSNLRTPTTILGLVLTLSTLYLTPFTSSNNTIMGLTVLTKKSKETDNAFLDQTKADTKKSDAETEDTSEAGAEKADEGSEGAAAAAGAEAGAEKTSDEGTSAGEEAADAAAASSEISDTTVKPDPKEAAADDGKPESDSDGKEAADSKPDAKSKAESDKTAEDKKPTEDNDSSESKEGEAAEEDASKEDGKDFSKASGKGSPKNKKSDKKKLTPLQMARYKEKAKQIEEHINRDHSHRSCQSCRSLFVCMLIAFIFIALSGSLPSHHQDNGYNPWQICVRSWYIPSISTHYGHYDQSPMRWFAQSCVFF